MMDAGEFPSNASPTLLRAILSQRLLLSVAGTLVLVATRCSSPPPIPVSGLQLWLKADAGVTRNGSKVSRWIDQSGNGNNAIQMDVERQPVFVTNELNGKPVLRFDGADDKLGLTGSQRMSQLSLFVVFRIDSGATGPNPYYLIIFGDIPGDGQVFYLSMRDDFTRYSPDTMYIGAGLNSGVQATAPRCAAFGRWNCLSVQTNHTMWDTRMRANGVDASIARRGNNMFMSVPLGNPGANGAGGIAGNDVARLAGGHVIAKCDVAEVIVYDTELPDSLRGLVESYLTAKYGIPH